MSNQEKRYRVSYQIKQSRNLFGISLYKYKRNKVVFIKAESLADAKFTVRYIYPDAINITAVEDK